jgi:peptidoglycan/LPS O-acetylase OafA/YrhL
MPSISKNQPHPSSPSDGATYRADIDGLRGLAVMLVVVYHYFPGFFRSGFIGVDIFFVISGFLISGHIFEQFQGRTFSLLDFYRRRVIRIFPALLLVMLACFVFAWIHLLPVQFKSLGKHIAAGAAFVSNVAFWQEAGYFGGDSALKPLLHLWSLAIEEQFYLVWPLALWVVWRFKPSALMLVMLLLLAASFLANLWGMRSDRTAVFYLPFGRFWELILGAVAALWVRRQGENGRSYFQNLHHITPVPNEKLKVWLSWIGLVLLALAIYYINPQRKFPGSWALLPTLGAVCLLIAGPHTWLNRVVLAHPLLRYPGTVSYAWYLWHWPLLAFAHIEVGDVLPKRLAWGLLLASFALAVVTTYLIEHPLRFSNFWRRWRTALGVTLVVLMTAVGGAGYNVYARDGLAFRLPPVVRDLANPTVDMFAGWRRGTCLIEAHQKPEDYAADCVETIRPLVFFWGDSHAGALMPGLKSFQADQKSTKPFGLGQRTGATCPPVPASTDPWCRSVNENTLALVQSIKPEIVVLHAYWPFEFYDKPAMLQTIATLRASGVAKLILLGAPPYWNPPLPQAVLKAWEAGPPALQPPFRLKQGVVPLTFSVDQEMAALAKQAGVQYISMVDLLCNDAGCQTRLTSDGGAILSHDYGHLSHEGAVWVANKIMPQILAD